MASAYILGPFTWPCEQEPVTGPGPALVVVGVVVGAVPVGAVLGAGAEVEGEGEVG